MPSNTPLTLVLASQSSYRQAQLRQLGLSFLTQPAHINESVEAGETAHAAASRLAEQKACAIAPHHPNAIIIGCDQTAEFNNQILGKPGTTANAITQLLACQGNSVTFHSALCVLNTQSNHVQHFNIRTAVTFRKLTESQIRSYIERESPLDCAGSFKCEGLGIGLFESIHSDDPSALIGLPLIALCTALQDTPFQPI